MRQDFVGTLFGCRCEPVVYSFVDGRDQAANPEDFCLHERKILVLWDQKVFDLEDVSAADFENWVGFASNILVLNCEGDVFGRLSNDIHLTGVVLAHLYQVITESLGQVTRQTFEHAVRADLTTIQNRMVY